MDYNKKFDQIESILTDVLRVQDRLAAGQEQLANGQEQLVNGQNQLLKTVDRMGLVMDKMLDVLIETKDEIKGLRIDSEKWKEHERRIRKIEQKLSIEGE
jgi:transposase